MLFRSPLVDLAIEIELRIFPTEVRETAQLYLDGKIDQWYSLEDRPGVVFILNIDRISTMAKA